MGDWTGPYYGFERVQLTLGHGDVCFVNGGGWFRFYNLNGRGFTLNAFIGHFASLDDLSPGTAGSRISQASGSEGSLNLLPDVTVPSRAGRD